MGILGGCIEQVSMAVPVILRMAALSRTTSVASSYINFGSNLLSVHKGLTLCAPKEHSIKIDIT